MAYNNVVDTITLEDIAPRVVDTVLRTNRLTTKVLSKTKAFRAATQDFPIKYQVGTPVQSFVGFDALPVNFTDTRVLLKYNPKFVAANMALAGTDIMANNVIRKVLDLTKIEMISRAQDLADAIGTMLYADGTGNNSKDFLGLKAIVDDGTNVSTIGGLSRSTYPTLKGTVTSASTLALTTMRTLWNTIGDMGVYPDVIFTDYPSFSYYEQLLQPQEKIYKELTFNPDYKMYEGVKEDGLAWAGMSVWPDRKCTAGYMYMLNTDFLHFYALDAELPPQFGDAKKVDVGSKLFTGNQYNETPNLGFYWTNFIKINNQFAFNSFIIQAGNLLTDDPRRHGVLTGIAGI